MISDKMMPMRTLLVAFVPVLLVAGEVRVGVDPRVELFSVVFRLAGAQEYSRGLVPAYTAAIDRHFGAFKDHAAVRLAKGLRKSDGVAYDAVMSLAIHVSEPPELRELIPFDRGGIELDKRWHGAKSRAFLAEVRKFAAASEFSSFWKSHEKLYEEAGARLRTMVEEKGDIGWFERFFGLKPEADFAVVAAMNNGPSNYGPAFQPVKGPRQVYAIIGAGNVDASGVPQFSGDVATMVHEFVHSFANPLIDKRLEVLSPYGEKLFGYTMADMVGQAYSNGRTVLCESLVRAVTVRFVFEHGGPDVGRRAMEQERARAFVWTPKLVEALHQYAANREKYPSMEAFLPELERVFRESAENVATLLNEYDAERPKVASISIADGAKDVDPAMTELVIRFDRPMRKANYSIARTSSIETPRFGKPEYNEDGTMLKVPITLEPGKEYAFSLNWPMGGSFASEAGVLLRHVEVRFRTKN